MRAWTLAALAACIAAVPAVAQVRCDNCGRIERINIVTRSETWVPLGSMTPDVRSGTLGEQGRVTSVYNFTSGNMVLL